MFLEFLLLPITFFIIISLIILPFQFAFNAFINIFTIPIQLVKIATNKRLRTNHALEHSTINILEQKYGYRKLSGYAKENGFFIHGRVDPRHLEQAALIGLDRLKAGNRHLAIHDRCGTSMLAANFSSAVIFVILLWQTGMFSIFNVLAAIFLAQLVGPLSGKLLQKFVTTSVKVNNMEIIGVEFNKNQSFGLLGGIFATTPSKFFVRTKKISDLEVVKL